MQTDMTSRKLPTVLPMARIVPSTFRRKRELFRSALPVFAAIATILLISAPANAQDNCDAACQAARNAQDPLAPVTALITDNTIGYGPTGADTTYNYQLQPVYSIKGERANVILRGVLPYVRLPNGTGGTNSGLGDIILQGFYVPNGQEGFKFGFGPQVSLKTRSNAALGGPGYGIGGVVVGFGIAGNLSYGGIVGHLWGGNGFSATTINPIVFYNMDLFGGSYVGYSNTIAYNWKATSGNKWTAPIGLTFGKTWVLNGGYALDTSIGAYKVASRPSGSNDTQFKFAVSLFLP